MKMPRDLIPSHVQNGDQTRMRPRNGFEALHADKFALEWPRVLEAGAINNLHGAIIARDAAGQPNVTVAALANAAHQLVIGNHGRTGSSKALRHACS